VDEKPIKRQMPIKRQIKKTVCFLLSFLYFPLKTLKKGRGKIK